MHDLYDWLTALLGLGSESREITIWQMALRAAIIYVVTILIVRLGKKRFMGRATAFDVILGIMLGSIVSRAITGNAPFMPAIGASAVLVAMHWLFSEVALHWHGFGVLIKGRPIDLVRNGVIDWKRMSKSHMTEHDLWEDLRSKSVSDLGQVAEARLERSGQVSVIKTKPEPKVFNIEVAEGVQTIRVEIAG